MPEPADVPTSVRDLARRLAEPKPMRRGTLAVRYQRCNKPGCACAERADARHGPYHSVVRVVDGKTRSRHVPAEQAELLRQQVQAGQRFRQEVDAFWLACEQWADAQLAEAASETGAAKKRGSRRRSRARSSPRSKRS